MKDTEGEKRKENKKQEVEKEGMTVTEDKKIETPYYQNFA